jgi:hypothetical protein
MKIGNTTLQDLEDISRNYYDIPAPVRSTRIMHIFDQWHDPELPHDINHYNFKELCKLANHNVWSLKKIGSL